MAAFTIADLSSDTVSKQKELTLELIARGTTEKGVWVPGPLWWVRNCTETFDNHYQDKGLAGPYRPFPDLPYLPWLFHKLLAERIIFVPKSREMLLSWAVVAYCVWVCQLFAATRVLIQSQKLEKSSELVKGTYPPGYARTLYERQDDWLKERFPLATRLEDQPSDRLAWKNGSAMQAIGRGADQVRLFHPTIFFVDEAAHMEECEASFSAALPVASQLILVSSAGPGFFGDVCSVE